MKKISILSPDTVPLSLTKNAPVSIIEDGKEYSILDKCTRSTGLGNRAWKMAEILSKDPDFQVTLFVPDLNFPGSEYINISGVKFKIRSYNFKAALWNWSEELDRKLKGEDFVIVQSTVGTGFLNCAVLPPHVNVILDGYIPILAELPCALLGYSSVYKKTFWNRFMDQYTQLLKRADCVLYANDNQQYYYEGQLFSLGRLNWSAYQFSPLHKVPFGIDFIETSTARVCLNKTTNSLKLLWVGTVYPWYNPEVLIKQMEDLDNVSIDFVGIVHPRYKKSYYAYFSKFFERASDYHNINVIENYQEIDYNDYDAGIILAHDWLEEKYSVRSRVLDMLANRLPVLINRGNPLFTEIDGKSGLYDITSDDLSEKLTYWAANKHNLIVSDDTVSFIRNHLNWDTVLKGLKNYIKRFYYDNEKRQWSVISDENK